MTVADCSRRAPVRMAQRGIREDDLQLAMLIGTEVEGGYFVRDKNCEEEVRRLKKRIGRVLRLKGVRTVVAGDRVVTTYHAARKKERTLLRRR
ncbi:MAG: hypothetical protein M0002_10300 [Rhodospirillales bacterium]|nr:hypothetical protein [Rhodospirillales bacterium]